MELIVGTIVPLVVAFITVFGGIFVYRSQKKEDRLSELNRRQQENYREYLFAMQRVLTSTVRSQHQARRQAIDDFRSFEAAIYVTAPKAVAQKLAPLHDAFFDYTRSVRVHYEDRQREKFGEEFPTSRLSGLEKKFIHCYRDMLREMRHATLGDRTDLDVRISLASKELVAKGQHE